MGWSVARPTGLTYHQRSLSTPGYTLFTPHGGQQTHLIDLEGRVVHQWTFSHIRPGYGRLLSNGNLLMTGSDIHLPDPPQDEPTKPPPPFEQHVTRLGGYHTTLCEVSWDGEVVWEYVNRAQHHDFFRFPNGNTLLPEWVELPEDLHRRVKGGYKKPGERLPRLLGDDLVEIDRELREVRRIHTWKLLDPRTLPIHHVFHDPRLLAGIEQLLGPRLIINNASLFAAEPGTTYKLGWHRDVIQIPPQSINARAIFNPDRFHNNVQANLPLYADDALWVVPGSHVRPNTPEEDAAFRGSRHYAPPGAQMPGGIAVHIPAGKALLYNNNLIHRGYSEAFQRRRLALHVGYHSRTRPPTWHFYLLNESMFTDDYRRQMSPRMRAMIEEYFECRREYPRMEDTWPPVADA